MQNITTAVPNSARVWNYWAGGKDYYEADRQAGDAYAAIAPHIDAMARSSREFLVRAVTCAAGELGARQFLDIGTGLPTHHNTHEVAQLIAPASRIVYVDNDPVVLAHARALLTSTPQGSTDYIDADLHNPETILDAARRLLDFEQPVTMMLMGILGHIQDYTEATEIIRHLTAALPAGSLFIHYDGINTNAALTKAQAGYDATGAIPYVLRSPQQIAAYYDGMELLDPGIVPCSLWRPDPGPTPAPTDVIGAVAYTR
ncbi:SAM-dependent methyltransferase [Streptomyces sp. NPDC002514]|uniref:SAM-dependent methyltransferase n=1 Tax=Streptomyces sp. NPDC001270 TaxID=3364554 RepID=UPI0036BED974